MLYLLKNKEDTQDGYDYYDTPKVINLKNVPSRYRNKEIFSFHIEQIKDKTVLFLLTEDSVMLTLDFTKIKRSKEEKSLLTRIFLDEFNFTSLMIICANLLTMLIYVRVYRNRRIAAEAMLRRTSEINQVVQEIIRLNSLQSAIIQSMNVNPNNIPSNHNANIQSSVDNPNEANQSSQNPS